MLGILEKINISSILSKFNNTELKPSDINDLVKAVINKSIRPEPELSKY